MRIKFVDKAIKLYKRITGRFEPITSKCVHDNIFAIAGQSAFFIILSAVPLSMFFVSLCRTCTFRLILFITDSAVCFRQKLPMI